MLTVTTPAPDRTLLTIGELRAAAGINGTGSDTELAALGDRVAAMITQYCGVAIGGVAPPTLRQERLTEIDRPSGRSDTIVLARRPVVAILSITEGASVLTTDLWELDASAGLLYRLSGDSRTCWMWGKITIVYDAGFDEVPDDLKLAASKMVALTWSLQGRDPMIKSEDIPGVRQTDYWVGDITGGSGFPADVAALLATYQSGLVST